MRDKEESLFVGVHNIMITEPHPCRRGFFRRLYARVDVSHTGQYWVWRQIDENGLAMTDPASARQQCAIKRSPYSWACTIS